MLVEEFMKQNNPRRWNYDRGWFVDISRNVDHSSNEYRNIYTPDLLEFRDQHRGQDSFDTIIVQNDHQLDCPQATSSGNE